MATDPWGSGAVSWREKMERAYLEIRRRIKVEAQNDPNFVPPANDVSLILAARQYVLPPFDPPPPPGDASYIIAAKLFGRRGSVSSGAAALERLTAGTHLAGGPYDGSSPVTLTTDAVSTNTVSTIVARDVNGDFAARNGTFTQVTGTLQTAAQPNVTSLGVQAANVSCAPGFGLSLDTGGTGDMAGTATLVAGTKTVTTTAISANAKVIYSRATTGGTVGFLSYTRVNGTSITFNSTSATDTSSIDWVIVNTF